MTRIKLCGLSRPEDIRAANSLRPDYIGFVFAPKSPRRVSVEDARELRRILDPSIRSVGVFVREDPALVAGLLESGIIDIAQLHGEEDKNYIRQLRAMSGHPIIQAFRNDTAADLVKAQTSPADYVLLDNGPGGTGNVFDWTLLEGFPRPFFLAGGLTPENAVNAIRSVHPFAVDVSSGIETNGYKDPEKMKRFVHAVRTASEKEYPK